MDYRLCTVTVCVGGLVGRIVLGTLLVWQPISGWLTDVYAKQQHRILLFSAVVELAMLGAMLAVILFSSSFNPWSVLGFQVWRLSLGLATPQSLIYSCC